MATAKGDKRNIVKQYNYVTDEEVEKEIEKLKESPLVKLARKEMRLKYKYRQALYNLRALEKRGAELRDMGITVENINERISDIEVDDSEEGEF